MTAHTDTTSSSAVAAAAEHPGARHPSLAAAVRSTALVTLGSRFGGLLRDVLVARVFGAGPVQSAFQFAFAVPNMFRRLFGEGALAAAFLPEYTDAAKSSNPADGGKGGEGGGLASLTIAALGALTAALTTVIELALLALLLLLPADPVRDLSLKLVMVMLPFMPLICIAAILAAMLQVHGRFGPAASGPLLLNGFIVAVAAFFLVTGRAGGPGVAYAIGVATVLSGLSQCLWFARLLRPHVRWTRAWHAARPRAVAMLRRFVPVMIGLGTLQLAAFADSFIAMYPNLVGPTIAGRAYPLDQASNGLLALTQRLYQFPLGVFGIAVATAVFPMLARTRDDADAFADTLRRGIRLSLFIGLPASAGLALVRTDALAVLYSGGARGFTADDLSRASAILLGYALGVWAYSANHVFTRAFYARGDTRTPMVVSIACVTVNLALNIVLIWPLREAGLAWATAATAALQCAVLAALARRRLGLRPIDAPTLVALARTGAVTLAMTAAVAVALLLLPAAATWPAHALRLAAACAVGALSYLALARLANIEELRWLISRRAA